MPFDDFNVTDDVVGADADDKCKLVAQFDVPQPTPPPPDCAFLFSSTFELYFNADLMGILLLPLRCWALSSGVSALVVTLAPLHDSERVDREKLSNARRMEEVERRCRREKLARALERRSLAAVDFVVAVTGECRCCCCSSLSTVLLVSLEAHDMCSQLEP